MIKVRREMDIRAYQKSDYTQGQNIVIYGAGIYGEIAFQCLRTWGIRAFCFADRNENLKKKFGLLFIKPPKKKTIVTLLYCWRALTT